MNRAAAIEAVSAALDGRGVALSWFDIDAVIDAALPHLDGDEHHSIGELYLYRMLYHAHSANEWARHGTFPVVKSWFHSDGEPCFGGGWFIVVATLPTGQVSNHYRDEFWNLFRVPEVPLPPEYDGHTPEDAATRLRSALDAFALPHLAPEPDVYVVVDDAGLLRLRVACSERDARERARYLRENEGHRAYTVVALVPVEDANGRDVR